MKQYSLREILAVWAAAAVPMGLLAWVVAPWLADQLGGDEPLTQALLIVLTAGLIWQFVLVLILLRRELGSLEWPRVRDALWLRPPRDPKTGRVGGKIWWWALLFVALGAVWAVAPAIPGPYDRDFAEFVGSDRGEDFFSGEWGWFALVVVFAVFNTVLGEELLFRGVLLPRMRGVFGKRDWVANGAIFTIYHLHVPWVILPTLVDGIFLEAYPSRRFQSAWMGIIVHSRQSVLLVRGCSRPRTQLVRYYHLARQRAVLPGGLATPALLLSVHWAVRRLVGPTRWRRCSFRVNGSAATSGLELLRGRDSTPRTCRSETPRRDRSIEPALSERALRGASRSHRTTPELPVDGRTHVCGLFEVRTLARSCSFKGTQTGNLPLTRTFTEWAMRGVEPSASAV